MIRSISGSSHLNLYNTKAASRKGENVSFKKDMDNLILSNGQNDAGKYGISSEKKEELKDKYGKVEDLTIDSPKAYELMKELYDMGIITEEELKKYRQPDILDTSDLPFEVSVKENLDINDMTEVPLGVAFRLVYENSEKDALRTTNGEVRKDFLEQAQMYKKLTDIILYIFEE